MRMYLWAGLEDDCGQTAGALLASVWLSSVRPGCLGVWVAECLRIVVNAMSISARSRRASSRQPTVVEQTQGKKARRDGTFRKGAAARTPQPRQAKPVPEVPLHRLHFHLNFARKGFPFPPNDTILCSWRAPENLSSTASAAWSKTARRSLASP